MASPRLPCQLRLTFFQGHQERHRMPVVDGLWPEADKPLAGHGSSTLVHVSTADGARLAVKRRPVAGGVPVVLAHGMGANANQWDVPDVRTAKFQYCSLASQLQECGFDVWMLNVRGAGRPSMYSEPPAHQRDWNVDHYITCDLPR